MTACDRNFDEAIAEFARKNSATLAEEFSDIEDHRRAALMFLLASKVCDIAACEIAWHCDPSELKKITKARSALEKQAQDIMKIMSL